MGRGNVCVTGSYEGLFYIDNDDLRVYRKDGPGTDDCEDRLQRDLDYADITGPDWYLDEVGSSYEEADVLECFCNEMRKLCPKTPVETAPCPQIFFWSGQSALPGRI